MADQRYRTWWFVVWLESASFDYIENLKNLYMKGFISPVHGNEPDGNGGFEHPHRHVILTGSNKFSYDQMLEIAKKTCGMGVNTVKRVLDLGPAARYLIHLGYDDKPQYKAEDVISLGGASYLDACLTTSDFNKYDRQIKQFIEQWHVNYYSQLSDYATFVNPEWRQCIDNRTVFWLGYLKARSTQNERMDYREIDDIIEASKKLKIKGDNYNDENN